MDSKIGFEMSLIVVEAICGRCSSFMILTATVSEIFGVLTDKLIYLSIIQELLLKGAVQVLCNAGVSVFSEKSVTMKVYGSTL